MPSILLDVGKLVHKYCEHNLMLITNCSVQLSVPEHIAIALSNSQQLEQLTYQDLWLARGDALRISVQISFAESVLSCLDKPALIEGLGQTLRDAEIWSQLCLQASLTLPTADDGPTLSTADIVLSLTHSPASTKGTRYVSHVQPPAGVAQGGLHSVNISFCLSDTSPGKPKKKRLRLQEMGSRGLDTTPLPPHDYDLATGERPCKSQPSLGSLQTFDNDLEEYRSASQPVYLLDENLLDGQHGPERGTNSPPSMLPNLTEASDPPSSRNFVWNKTSKRRADHELFGAGLDLSTLVELIDIALRTLICDYKITVPSGIKWSSRSVGPKLSNIAPALFSPGYLAAVSQRSHFLPRIAHAFPSLQRRACSATLREKLDRIAERRATVSTHDDEILNSMDPIRGMALQIRTRLWSMLQRTLFDRLAVRKLKPLKVPHSGLSLDRTFPGEMLEDLPVSSLEAELKSSARDEDVELLFADYIDGGEDDDLLFPDGVNAEEILDEDGLLDDYQDEESDFEWVKERRGESSHDVSNIGNRSERIDSVFTRDFGEDATDLRQALTMKNYNDRDRSDTFQGRECERELWQRNVADRNESMPAFELCLRPADGSTLEDDEMML